VKASRRAFLETGSGLALGFFLPGISKAAPSAPFQPNAYIRVTPDNVVTLWISRSEMGQGVRTNLACTLAEELEVDLAVVRLEQAMPSGRFKGIRLRTSGSGSSSGTFTGLRKAGATAREMLIAAGAETWGVEPSTCRAELGSVLHIPSGRKLTYGALSDRASKQAVPSKPAFKDPKDFRLIGKPVKRIDGPAIVSGEPLYGLDIRVPGMMVAVMERCPCVGGKIKSFDASKALAIPGVRKVVPVQAGIFGGVAVVADNTWAAMKGREALHVEWDAGANGGFDSTTFMQRLHTAAGDEGYPIRREGDVASSAAARQIEAAYEYPFQAHAPVEPMNCIADVRANSCEIWAPSQTPETAQQNITKALGLPPEAITIHTTLMGGGFGRRLFVDYVDEAVEISKAIGKPVQLVWSRSDDMRNGFFHPASVEHFRAAIDEGQVVSWQHKSVGSPLSMFGLPTPEDMKNRNRYAEDESPWGAFDTPYKFPALKIDYVPVDSPVPSGAWRAVEYPSRVFGRESFMDEVAHALGKDPLQLRIDLLQPGDVIKLGDQNLDRGRMIRVLEATREKSDWAKPFRVPGRLAGRGVAINIYHTDSYLAQVAEVSMASDLTDLRIHRILCVVDCGLAINPAGLEGQVESGITWGLSATLHGKIDFRNGRAEQSGFHDFQVIRMDEMPRVETHIVPSPAHPGGFGEHAVPPVAPAVANAIFAATGKRVRRLPVERNLSGIV
jgi:isoquinoline 1-oxidoreductase subunit beta